MFYIDTSALIALLVGETSVERVLDWFAKNADRRTLVSEWTITEFSSALSVKARHERMPQELRQLALAGFNRMASQSLEILPIFSRHFVAAARLADDIDVGLRSGDPLHLAVAMEAGAEIVTLDKRFASAANALGGRSILL
ncbi:type II toxin-antitoxin system VapC family toxin [Neorhizobium galegae]|uniref:type II toxin-antitoxin system VapC family toxin n=1 Tax=Neorhizobium galegae TaxID=399 RepID=UPI0021076CA9|nr:type II toxin-antitoxin system VapC family toxin [Neorhizobium galegae]MCQ1836210.1 type II toxin-antitoxin system VapC family toxin [Neorhizobium galegae]